MKALSLTAADLTSEKIRDLILKNNLRELKDFIGENPENFIQIMELKSPKFSFIQLAAQNGKLEFVKFFIENARKSEKAKRLLMDQLLKKDEAGRNIIHIVAPVNKAEVAPCLREILAFCKELDILNNLINEKDIDNGIMEGEFTPFMLAAKYCALENIRILVEFKADITQKSTFRRNAYEIALGMEPKNALPILKYLISDTAFKSVFQEKFGDIENILKETKDSDVDTVVTRLLEIEMDTSIAHPAAQLSALSKITEYTLSAKNSEEAKLYLLNYKYVNFSQALEGYQKSENGNKGNEILNGYLAKIIEIQREFKLSENEYEDFAKGWFISQFDYPESQEQALLLFSGLQEAPHKVIIAGLNAINNEEDILDKAMQEALGGIIPPRNKPNKIQLDTHTADIKTLEPNIVNGNKHKPSLADENYRLPKHPKEENWPSIIIKINNQLDMREKRYNFGLYGKTRQKHDYTIILMNLLKKISDQVSSLKTQTDRTNLNISINNFENILVNLCRLINEDHAGCFTVWKASQIGQTDNEKKFFSNMENLIRKLRTNLNLSNSNLSERLSDTNNQSQRNQPLNKKGYQIIAQNEGDGVSQSA